MDSSRRRELLVTCQLIFYGIPIGANAPGDTPIVGNLSLAQIVLNRIKSTAKNAEEFKFMTGETVRLLKETKGQSVTNIKLDQTNSSLVRVGLTDSKGFIIKKKL